MVHVGQLHHDAKALASSRAKAPDAAVSERSGVEPEAGEQEAAKTFDEQAAEEAEEEKKAMEKAMADAVAEQKKLEEAEQDKKALGVSMQRVAELEVRTWGRYRGEIWPLVLRFVFRVSQTPGWCTDRTLNFDNTLKMM